MLTISQYNGLMKSAIQDSFSTQSFTVTGNTTQYYTNGRSASLILVERDPNGIEKLRIYIPGQVFCQAEQYLTDGLKIEVTGNVGVYNNQLQLIANSIRYIGSGDFIDWENQTLPGKKICRFPADEIFADIAVIGSPDTHGYIDFDHNLRYGRITTFPAKMQGPDMVESISLMIEQINQRADQFDCICIIRGGGNDIDLYDYNNPRLINAINDSKLPVFTGIGHHANQFVWTSLVHKDCSTPTAVATHLNEYHSTLLSNLLSKPVITPQPQWQTVLANLSYGKIIPSLVILYFIYKYLLE